MLTKISKCFSLAIQPQSITSIQIGHFSTAVSTKQKGLKKLTVEQIQRATNIKQLVQDTDITQLAEKPQFRLLMRKITDIMNPQQFKDPQSVKCLERLLLEIRKFSSAEIHSNASDLLNYQLFFKQLQQIFPKQYKHQGFQVRATIVAETMPKIASFDGCEPSAVALLHYMSTINKLSNDGMKRNIDNYFIRYFLSNKLGKQIANKNYKGADADKEKFNFDPNTCAILLGCNDARLTKTTLQSSIDALAIMNTNKNIEKFMSFLQMEQLLQLYTQKYGKLQPYILNEQEMGEITKILSEKVSSETKQVSKQNRNPILVINDYEKFLQATDTFVKLLKNNYKNILSTEIDYRASESLGRYFYMVFLLSQDMEVRLSHKKNKHVQWFTEEQSQKIELDLTEDEQDQTRIQSIKLWKVAAEIVQGFAKNRIYNMNKDKICGIILWKVIDYFKKNIQLKEGRAKSRVNKDISQEISGCQSSIIKLFTFMPIQTFRKHVQKQQNTHKYIFEVVKTCTKKLPENLDQRKDLVRNIIQLAKFKKTLLITKKQWIDIFSAIIKEDSEFSLWMLYYFLAQTHDQDFIKQIPFPGIIEHLSVNRLKLEKEGNYAPPQTITRITKPGKQSQNQVEIDVKKKWKSRDWELQVLSLHALAILANKQDQLAQMLAKNSKKYQLTLNQVENLFQIWIQPFKLTLLSEIKKKKINEKMMKEQQFKFEQFSYKDKPIPFYERYYHHIFTENETFYQFKLIYKILSNPTIENYLLHWQQYSFINFPGYFMTFLLGIADQKYTQFYQQKYPFEKINPKDLRPHVLFNCNIHKIIPQFFKVQQWSYLFKLLHDLKLIAQGRDLFMSILEKQQIYKAAAIRMSKDKQITKRQAKKVTKKYQKHKSSEQQQNQQLYQFLDYNFNLDYTYKNIKQGYKYNEEFFIKMNKEIINAFFIDLMIPTNFTTSNIRRLSAIVHYIEELAIINQHDLQPNLTPFIENKYVEQLEKFMTSYRLKDDKMLYILMHKLNLLGLLSPKIALHLCKNLQFLNKPAITKLICLSVIGKQKAIATGIVSEDSWNEIEGDATKVSSQIGYSFIWLYYSLKYSSPSRLSSSAHLLRKICNPVDKKLYMKQLRRAQQKYNIEISPSLQEIEEMYRYEFEVSSSKDNELELNELQEIEEALKNAEPKSGFFKKKFDNKNNKIGNKNTQNKQAQIPIVKKSFFGKKKTDSSVNI